MKYMQSSKSYLAMVGICRNKNLMNVNFLMTEINILAFALQNWLSLIFECSSFRDYTNSIFMTSTITMIAVCFTQYATKGKSIFKVIDILDEIFEKSKCGSWKKNQACPNIKLIFEKLLQGHKLKRSEKCICTQIDLRKNGVNSHSLSWPK